MKLGRAGSDTAYVAFTPKKYKITKNEGEIEKHRMRGKMSKSQ